MTFGRKRTVVAAVALVFCSAAASVGHGQSADLAQSKRYAKCMALARGDPDIGHKVAQAWRAGGGGMAARHCTAVSLLGLGHYAQAAGLLHTLANDAEARHTGLP